MKVITSHLNLDFDGLSSMVACSKIYPDANMIFSGRINDDVKRFYNLYKNILNIGLANKINVNEITELIIVDVNSSNRIGKFKDALKNNIGVKIYDHHPTGPQTIEKSDKIFQKYGSCTTILVEEIITKNIDINSFEATLFLLGIYADTNCLTFKNTTPNDAKVVSFLLEKGGDLDIVREHISQDLSGEHDKLLLSLLFNMETLEINNYKVIISTHETEEFIGELSYITNKILDIRKCDAIFNIVKMDNRIYIVGRGSTENINIREILAEFGGAGHLSAASANIKDGDISKTKIELLKILHQKIKPQVTAEHIMSYPVKSVFEDMTVEEVNKIMLRYGHTGMPVVKDERLIGIISRTDIDKAMIHKLGHAPVKAFMSREVKIVNHDTSINEINELLVKNNIGRLPVIRDEKIIGIVTRTDMLKILHGNNYPFWYRELFISQSNPEKYNCVSKLNKLPPNILSLLKSAGEIGDKLNYKVFVVGGFVRDLILNRPNFDIDIVIEGDGIEFAEEFNKRLNGTINTYASFGTATVILETGEAIDIVTARREYYEHPAALPKIEKSSIWSDLFRRDFTINCMALQLNEKKFGTLLDYFGGLEDLENKKIRILYNLSFIEDPTRIFRAIRFAARMNFAIEEETKEFICKAISENMIKKLSEDRIREELVSILKDSYPHLGLKLLTEYGVINNLNSDLIIDADIIEKVQNITKSIKEFDSFNIEISKYKVIVLQILSSVNNLDEVMNLFFTTSHFEEIKNTLAHKNSIYEALLAENLDKYHLFTLLKGLSIESLVFYYNDCNDEYMRHYIMLYMLILRNISIHVTGEDLKKLNISPGPIYKKIFDEILKAKILGLVYSKEDELKFIEKNNLLGK
ncbi:CBS domain-containing protein [Serpentinicella alkaliphila]|uniref:tRNA nucleotidyltransferase (CCA-adding enzyme) n=1 Tax=Serpentinicella alkaliphila TaxID=1734049 RepID=A0A4R2TNT8_9FIRM|nr:CBS domain-containing protein [Serpentinicella alkaliphila]QUH26583.1 CBS domain-containing protein [Serpentinicella alkaliphila]TCP99068.1 tRNA nucleotidyltransferase (CCA-adding enzyme) [Serpentinicella alkaliphila]